MSEFHQAVQHERMRLVGLIAEAKEIVPARYGYRAVVKHVPDQAFMLDEQLYRRLGRRFESELALWSAANDLHMVLVATFGVSDAGVPAIAELSLMPVTAQWLPIADSFEQQLLERLIRDERSFVKGLRYNMPTNRALASAILTDVGDSPVPLYVAPHGLNADVADATATADPPAWHWAAASEPMPALPARHPRAVPTRSGIPQPEHSI